ncbi:integrase [Acuticoccus sediminis]|uniref:Integrase n=1 Tax=Acuticoccus sediminis TaxID=2184697 RepID=A0A8B2NJC7_9HYPH|nr:integrase [Acuticoccus sediminis]
MIRLVVMSFVVGLILTMLDINPNDIINWVDQRFRALTNLGFESVSQFFNIMIVGAVIVVPIWLFARVIRILSK